MVLVDTSVWIDFLNGAPSPQAQRLKELIASDEPIAILGVILTEILLGLKSDNEARRIQELLSAFEPAPELSDQDYFAAAKIYRDCRNKGLTLRSTIDCLIAQICIRHKLRLLAKDRDFTVIAKLFPLELLAAK